MNPKRMSGIWPAVLALLAGSVGLMILIATLPSRASTHSDIAASPTLPAPAADNPSPPAAPVKLIFIHHSTGGNWLADPNSDQPYGGLGIALRDNNYFVSATNYGWGPIWPDQGQPIGSFTDIIHWPVWFTGQYSSTILAALYNESNQNICNPSSPSDDCFGNWSRLLTNPGGENEIIMFKSCFPNSDLYGNPNDPPLAEPDDSYTVANAKAVYNEILTYFATRQDKLFIVITAPPLQESETAPERAANARAFNNWLVNDWLDGYPYNNVAVFDYYNVLTSNGGDANTNDIGAETGNHHRWWNGAVQHVQTVANNYAAYPSGDSHPTTAGHQKATAEFVPLLNVYYNRWKAGGTPCVALRGVTIAGPTNGYTSTQYAFTAGLTPANASTPITYTWTPAPTSGQGTATAHYTWPTVGTKSITITAQNCGGSAMDTHTITIAARPVPSYFIYLPVVLRNYASALPACAVPLTGVTISGPTSGITGTTYTFTAAPTPANATTPIAYTWSPAPQSGQNTDSATYRWATTGSQTISVATSNCSGAHTASDDHTITIQAAPSGNLVQPGDFTYLGAFRLPGGDEPPQTFAYGGNAMTYNPDNGTLFITGHDRLPYGDLPDGDQIAEVSIPTPVNSRNIADLPVATFMQNFQNPTAGYFNNMEEIPKIGLQYLNDPATGPLLHIAWGQHLQPDNEPSHGWFNATLNNPQFKGVWFIGNQNLYSTNGYMFDIPADWATAHTQGRPLATGRMRDGGQGGMGPALFAYRPWLDGGTAPISGTHISETVLLLYENSYTTEEITRCLESYQHPDEWEGGAWLTTASGKTAVLFAGTKGTGAKYWYGYIHPDGPQYPCVDTDVTDFVTCRLANGTRCPPGDFTGCCDGADCVSERGWWSSRFDAQFILYDPAQLAQVAAGTLESWRPQPYASVDIDTNLYLAPPAGEEFTLGWGDQRRYRIGDVAFDRANGRLYVLELYADGSKPVVHVWQVQ